MLQLLHPCKHKLCMVHLPGSELEVGIPRAGALPVERVGSRQDVKRVIRERAVGEAADKLNQILTDTVLCEICRGC